MFLLSPNLSDSGRHFVSVYPFNSSDQIGSRWVSIVFEPIICTGVTRLCTCVAYFAPVLHKSCTPFLANLNQVIFVCILLVGLFFSFHVLKQ